MPTIPEYAKGGIVSGYMLAPIHENKELIAAMHRKNWQETEAYKQMMRYAVQTESGMVTITPETPLQQA